MSFPRLPFITLCLVLGVGLMTGACAAPLAVSGAGYAADGGLLVASDKTSTDHMISMVSKQDCALWRVIKGRAVCKPREGDKDPYKVNYDDPQRMVAEDGVHYAPPLRATADAPATSWDAAAYKAAPAAPAPPSAAGDRRCPRLARCRTGDRRRAAAARCSSGSGKAEEAQGSLRQEAFTASGGACFLSRKASRLSSALKPMALRVSTVAEPMCGSRNALASS